MATQDNSNLHYITYTNTHVQCNYSITFMIAAKHVINNSVNYHRFQIIQTLELTMRTEGLINKKQLSVSKNSIPWPPVHNHTITFWVLVLALVVFWVPPASYVQSLLQNTDVMYNCCLSVSLPPHQTCEFVLNSVLSSSLQAFCSTAPSWQEETK